MEHTKLYMINGFKGLNIQFQFDMRGNYDKTNSFVYANMYRP